MLTPEQASVDVETLPLSTRTKNCLRNQGVRTLGEITELTDSEMLAWPNFGITSLYELRTFVERPRTALLPIFSQRDPKAEARAEDALRLRERGQPLAEIGKHFAVSVTRAGQLVKKGQLNRLRDAKIAEAMRPFDQAVTVA